MLCMYITSLFQFFFLKKVYIAKRTEVATFHLNSIAKPTMRKIHLAASRRDSRAVNQGYLSSNSAESSASRICPPDACSMPFMHLRPPLPFSSETRSWRVRKANLFPLAERGACILKHRCLQQQPMVANPYFHRCFFALSPFDSLSFSFFLFFSHFLSPSFSPSLLFSSLFAARLSDSLSNRTRSGDYFSFARFYLL